MPEQTFFGTPNPLVDQIVFNGSDKERTGVAAQQFLGESLRLAGEENRTRDERNDFLRGIHQTFLNRNATLGDDQMNSLFARVADAAQGQGLSADRDLRSALGSAGITGGGLAAGLEAQNRLRVSGQIVGGTRDLQIARMQQDAQDSIADLEAGFTLGNFLGEGPSLLGLDGLAQLTGLQFGREQLQAGKDAAKDASDNDFLGSLIGGGLGLVGAALGA